MAYANSEPDELRKIEEEIGNRSRISQRRPIDKSTEYKSKNLHAERRRRQKLSDKLLLLRSIIPIITNMNKATIIEDAITYIQQLQKRVNILKEQLEELREDFSANDNINITTPTNLIKTYVKGDVRVCQIDEHKLWIKILFQKQKGGLTKLIEALNSLGFEAIDTSVTTVQGAVIVTSIINGMFCTSTAQQTEDLLLQIVNGF